jgi:hypothetical protein
MANLGLTQASSNFVNSYMMGKQVQAERAESKKQSQIKSLMGGMLMGQSTPEQQQQFSQLAPTEFVNTQNYLQGQQAQKATAATALGDERDKSDFMELASTSDQATQDAILQRRINDLGMENSADSQKLLNMPFEQRQKWIGMKAAELDIEMPGAADVGKIGTYNPRDFTIKSFAAFVKGGMKDPSVLEKTQVKPVMIEGVPYLPSPDGTYKPVSVTTASEDEGTTTTELTPEIISQQAADAAAKKATSIEEAKLEVQKEFKPVIAEAVKLAEIAAKEKGEVLTDLARMEASLPGVRSAVNQLIDLSSVATSTLGGKAFDFLVKESGFGSTKGADARAKLIAIVDNQVLPLLRETFGAAFTAEEGKSLKASLVDPDASPSQKRAQLEAFLAQKIRNMEAKETQLKPAGDSSPADVSKLSDEELFN